LKYLEKDINVEYVAPEPELEPEAEPEPEPSFFNAIKDNNVEKVQEAINSEIDINEKNEEGLTPLMFAATKSSEPDIISLLINNGASIDEKDEDGWTPLMLASAFNENPEVVQRFIEEGADPNKQGEDGGDTALHKSIIFNRNVEIIKLLIDEGADINNADNLGYTPLMEVTMRSLFCNDEEEVINLLLNAGADINAKTKTGQTALTRTHNPKIKEVLIKAGAEGPTHIAWKRKFYVDSFGDPTEEPYITNIGKIEGTFSNTATNNSLLEAYFIIDNSNKIAFKLFEYGRDNPVKSYGNKGYKLLVKDASDTVHELYGNNYSDRITLNESSSNTLHNLLIDNDKLKIHIVESDNRTTTYDFELDARGYDYIYNEFLE
jgi:ankyrin repeat protein